MQEAMVPLLLTWQNFYVIIGAAAATLTGLMFVVITLIAGTRVRRGSETVAAFGTPTVVYFCVAFLVAAMLSAPWPAFWYVALLLGLSGIGGVIYIIVIVWRMRHQTIYTPVLEDWVWYVVSPSASFLAIILAAILVFVYPVPALFLVAAATLLFLFIGIHNSWDSVTYVVAMQLPREKADQEKGA